MARQPDLTHEEKKNVECLFNQGWSIRQIAVKLKKSTSAVRRVLNNHGYQLLGNRLTSEEKQRVVELYQSGCTNITSIARHLNRGETSIARVFRQFSLKTINPRTIPNPEKEMFVSLYLQGHDSIAEIARVTRRGQTTVGRFFKQHNLVSRYARKELTAEQINDMVAMYQSGRTSVQIGQKYKVSDDLVLSILRREGVEIRSRQLRRSKIRNHDYFSCIDTPEKAYFLGWIITDGSVGDVAISPKASRRLSLQIQGRDAYILREFELELGGSHDTVMFTNRGEACFTVCSKQLTDDLAKYHVVPRKTGSEVFPSIHPLLMPHLLRGIFDGDGCAYLGKYSLKVDICGSKDLCQGVKDYLTKTIAVNDNKIVTRKNQNIYIFSFSDRRDVVNFYRLIYQRSTICLERKKQKFQEYFERKGIRCPI